MRKKGTLAEISPQKLNEKEAVVPVEFKGILSELLWSNEEIIANCDKELGRTQAVKMKIDMWNHLPVRLRSYRTSS